MARDGAGPLEKEESVIQTYFGLTLDNKEKLLKGPSMVENGNVIVLP